MKTKIICEIHDSIFSDVYKPELKDYLEIAERVMTQDVRKHWDWIVTPLAVEIEGSDVSWFDKKPLAV